MARQDKARLALIAKESLDLAKLGTWCSGYWRTLGFAMVEHLWCCARISVQAVHA